jgi:uncharacterized membrane protein YphA (DoxX/SURF4 family)
MCRTPEQRWRLAGRLLAAGLVPAAVAVGATAAEAAPPGGGVSACPGGPAGLLGCALTPGRLAGSLAQAAGNSLMQGVTAWLTDGARWVLSQIGGMLASATRPDLGAEWWVGKYRLLLAFAMVVAVATLLLAIIQAGAKASWEGLAVAVGVDVPVAAVGGRAGPILTEYLVDVADRLSVVLLAGFGTDSATALGRTGEWLGTFGMASGQPPPVPLVVAALVALLTIVAGLLVVLELLLRANAIYLLVAMVPLAYAMRIFPVLRPVARRTTEVLIAIVFLQPIIALCVSLGAAAGASLGKVGDATAAQFGSALSGAVMLLLGALSPWAVLSLLPALEAGMAAARQRQAATAGPRSALQTVYVGSYLSRLTQTAGRTAKATAGGWPTSPAVVAAQVRAAAQTTATHVANATRGRAGAQSPGGPGGSSGATSRPPSGGSGQRPRRGGPSGRGDGRP